MQKLFNRVFKNRLRHRRLLPQQTLDIRGGAPSMSAENIAAGLKAGIESLVKDLNGISQDYSCSPGTIH